MVRMQPYWRHFSVERAEQTSAAAAWLVGQFVNASMPAPATHYDLIQFICASSLPRAIPVVSLCQDLRSVSIVRGVVYSKMPGDLIDDVVRAHPGVSWWVTKDGLHVEELPAVNEVSELSTFDQIAGPLVVAAWKKSEVKKNTSLAPAALGEIAIQLDAAGLALKDALQPSQWKKLISHNQKSGRAAIKTFEKLVGSMFSYMLRRRLYTARDNYIRARARKSNSLRQPIPKIFHSMNRIIC
jgi:hypothetical protein